MKKAPLWSRNLNLLWLVSPLVRRPKEQEWEMHNWIVGSWLLIYKVKSLLFEISCMLLICPNLIGVGSLKEYKKSDHRPSFLILLLSERLKGALKGVQSLFHIILAESGKWLCNDSNRTVWKLYIVLSQRHCIHIHMQETGVWTCTM